MAFREMEHDGGGTYLINTNSIPANQSAAYRQICSLTLSKGKWIVTATINLPSSSAKYVVQFTYYNTVQSLVPIVVESAGTGAPCCVNISEIIDIEDQSIKDVSLLAYTNTTYTGNYTGRLQAIKIED